MVLKLFGLGKKSDYYMEAPPAENGAEPTTVEKISATVSGAIDDSKKAVAAAADKVVELATDAVEEIKPSGNSDSSGSDSKAGAIKPEDVKAAVKAEADNVSGPSTVKPQSKKLKKTKSAAASESQPASTASAPAKAVVKPASQPETAHFAAAEGLMPLSTPRRRPGPSMAMFRNMAKDVKPRR